MLQYLYQGQDVLDPDYYEQLYWHNAEFRALEQKVLNYLTTMPPNSLLSLARYEGEKLAWIIAIIARVIVRQSIYKRPMEFLFTDERLRFVRRYALDDTMEQLAKKSYRLQR